MRRSQQEGEEQTSGDNSPAGICSPREKAWCGWQPSTSMHMQKALSAMNVQLQHVLSKIASVSGLKIPDAIRPGEHDPIRLSSLCNWCVRSAREIVAKLLEEDYRGEPLFPRPA